MSFHVIFISFGKIIVFRSPAARLRELFFLPFSKLTK